MRSPCITSVSHHSPGEDVLVDQLGHHARGLLAKRLVEVMMVMMVIVVVVVMVRMMMMVEEGGRRGVQEGGGGEGRTVRSFSLGGSKQAE